MSDGGLGLGPGWASARGGHQGKDGVREMTHSRGRGRGTGRASQEQGPRHESRVCPASGKDEREMSESGTMKVQFSEMVYFRVKGRSRLCLKTFKIKVTAQRGCGARNKLPGAMAGDSMCGKSS